MGGCFFDEAKVEMYVTLQVKLHGNQDCQFIGNLSSPSMGENEEKKWKLPPP